MPIDFNNYFKELRKRREPTETFWNRKPPMPDFDSEENQGWLQGILERLRGRFEAHPAVKGYGELAKRAGQALQPTPGYEGLPPIVPPWTTRGLSAMEESAAQRETEMAERLKAAEKVFPEVGRGAVYQKPLSEVYEQRATEAREGVKTAKALEEGTFFEPGTMPAYLERQAYGVLDIAQLVPGVGIIPGIIRRAPGVAKIGIEGWYAISKPLMKGVIKGVDVSKSWTGLNKAEQAIVKDFYLKNYIPDVVERVEKVIKPRAKPTYAPGTTKEVEAGQSKALERLLEINKEVDFDTPRVLSGVQDELKTVESELMARSTPFHGGVKGNPYPDMNVKELDSYHQSLREFEANLSPALPVTPPIAVQTGLPGVGPKVAQAKAFEEWGTAPGAGGVKPGLVDVEALKAQQAARPLPGQVGLPEVPAVPPVAEGAKAVAKEPWQMTKEEFVNARAKRLAEGTEFRSRFSSEQLHRRQVEGHLTNVKLGIEEGLVPPEVLKDYPDLAKAIPAKAAPVTPEAVAPVKPVAPKAEVPAVGEKLSGDQLRKEISRVESQVLYGQQRLKSGTNSIGEKLSKGEIQATQKQLATDEQTLTNLKTQTVTAAEVPPIPPEKPPAAMGAPEIPPEAPMKPIISKVKPPEGVIPPNPVVTPDGKLWLPEPPREKPPFMAFARKEMAGSFRKKVGVFDTIEQAQQQVRKARSMGDDSINYVDSYIRQGKLNITKEFGLDAQGMATKVVNPANRSLAINDILSNYTHYQLTPAQAEIAKRQGFVYKEALKLAKSYGVEISELGSPDEFWQYIARRVKSKLNPLTGQYETPPAVTGGFRMGAKIGAQKERIFEEMLEGIDLGLLYEHPDQVMTQHIKGIYRLIGNKQAEETVRGLTRAITEEAPLVFGERAIAQPALRSRGAATEVANAIDKIFTPEQEIKALRVAADISGAMVGQVAALDISAPYIQGLPALGHDLKMGLKGKPSFIWAKAYGSMWKAVWNPQTINNFRMRNQPLYKRAIEAGIMTGQSEFVSGIPLAGRMLGKIPKVGTLLREVYRQSWGRMGQAYSDFLEVARIKLFEQMEGAWLRSGGNVFDLGAVVNRMTGTVSAAGRGVGANRRLLERTGAFAPNYLRSSLLLIKDMMGRGATAKEVQSTIATMLGVGAAVYYAEEKVRGREPKIKPWPKRLGGDGAEAFTTEIAGQRVGLGSWMYGMLKTLAEVGAIAVDDPASLLKWNNQHPIARFAKSKTGPGISLVTEMATGRNFYGKPFEHPSDYLLRIAESLIPIAAQSLVERETPSREKEPLGVATRIGAELQGFRAFPYTLQSQWRDAGVFKEYEAIPQDEMERKFQRLPYSREQLRKRNPDLDAKLFVTGQTTSVLTPEAGRIVMQIIQEKKIDPETIPGVKRNKELLARQEELGLPNERVTQTEALTIGLTGGAYMPPSGTARRRITRTTMPSPLAGRRARRLAVRKTRRTTMPSPLRR